MISIEQIRTKAKGYWDSQRLMRAELSGEKLFPLVIPFRKPNAEETLREFAQIREAIGQLRKYSKEEMGAGYTIEWKEVNTRALGLQQLPVQICFETAEDLCGFIGKERRYRRWKNLVSEIAGSQELLKPWLKKSPLRTLDNDESWPQILSILKFFQTSPRPNIYVRQLEIPGVDTKFIERHRPLLWELLDVVLPPEAINEAETEIFEARFGLQRDEPLIRFRILDSQLAKQIGFRNLSMPLSEWNLARLDCSQVFITENKVNGLSFPDHPKSIVVFGLGNGSALLKQAEWLRDVRVCYWGDIDTYGFYILSHLRGFLPNAESFLMDRQTLLAWRHLWGSEPLEGRYQGEISRLFPEEAALFDDLRSDRLGIRVRLEQERIPFSWVCQNLRNR